MKSAMVVTEATQADTGATSALLFGRSAVIAVGFITLMGCSEEQIQALETQKAELTSQLEQTKTALADAREELSSGHLKIEELEKKLLMESPSAYFGMLSELRDNPSAWEAEARRFLEIHSQDSHAPQVRQELNSIVKERKEAERIAALRSVSMASVYAQIGEYQGRKLDRNVTCYPPRVDDAMWGRMALMAHSAGLTNSERYTHSLNCQVVGESNPHMTVYIMDSQLKQLPGANGRFGAYDFATRMRVLGRYGSDVAMAAHQIL